MTPFSHFILCDKYTLLFRYLPRRDSNFRSKFIILYKHKTDVSSIVSQVAKEDYEDLLNHTAKCASFRAFVEALDIKEIIKLSQSSLQIPPKETSGLKRFSPKR
jgi:hypothetical protein